MLSAALTASRNRAWTVKPRIVADFQIMSVMLTSAFQVDRASDLWRSHATRDPTEARPASSERATRLVSPYAEYIMGTECLTRLGRTWSYSP
jgi:hypothetical protein